MSSILIISMKSNNENNVMGKKKVKYVNNNEYNVYKANII